MKLDTLLNKKQMSKYQLSKISGIPKTTVTDIFAGRSSIERCSAKTVYQLAKALECSMEELMQLEENTNHCEYLECGLPDFLRESIDAMNVAWNKIDNGEDYLHWDGDFCNLQTDINNAEVNDLISGKQAWYLREKYLRMKREEDIE
ncbi:DNA-binding Xre family transcriptional regulator [Aequitasia blattaphilus]|uniref:Helix-turn-helix transcriptional regulator n=1 Tax=Aequitasia blattaphilus TaxID=2949332 RepID=A0ABT1E7L6_9FIRM|nr:helix-turn-helix transcriptional regulator [Aequitasia blattaphilus]MCP1101820.1 helix-turn-helix transcriptional regulator [Aequitasia blattaphilus]MCR8614460.1 helix-turn-helix transcriptional regulator [Aequitasia blattaphilus]